MMLLTILAQNPSITALQVALLFAISCWMMVNSKREQQRYIAAVLSALLLAVIVILGSRTAVIAALAAALYAFYPIFRRKYSRRKIMIVAGFTFLTLGIALAVYFKVDSTKGRWFIWENCWRLWQQNWLPGIGFGRFNSSYNHVQAQYFSTHSLTGQEAMLAASGYYPFNEWMFAAIEFGLPGLLCALLLTGYLLKICIDNVRATKGWAGAALITILVGCLFSYPLHNLPMLFAVAFLVGYTQDAKEQKIVYTKYVNLILVSICMLLLSVFAYHSYIQSNIYCEAKTEANEGYITQAVEHSAKIKDDLYKDNSFASFYLQLLYQTNRLPEAAQWFEQLHPYNCSPSIHIIAAKIAEGTGNVQAAETHYLTSLYIQPQLLRSRIELMDFYHRVKQDAKARYWAGQTLSCPVKIQSESTAILQQRARDFLMQ